MNSDISCSKTASFETKRTNAIHLPRSSNLSDRAFPGRFEAEYAIGGINEGFSDFMSFFCHWRDQPAR